MFIFEIVVNSLGLLLVLKVILLKFKVVVKLVFCNKG